MIDPAETRGWLVRGLASASRPAGRRWPVRRHLVAGQHKRSGRGTIAVMPNIASILKAEISRVARKEVRGEIQSLKKAAASYRSDIAQLKRRAQALEQQVKRLGKGRGRGCCSRGGRGRRPASAFQRQGPGVAAAPARFVGGGCGALIGATGQSVYKWESGKIRPRARHLPAIAALRKMGRREAAARLAELALRKL